MSETLTFENISKRKRSLIMAGLAIGLLAACFDGTVTTTCGPIIAMQFHATDLLPWLTTGYLLMETVSIPLSGKLSDLYGRKKLLMAGLVLFGLASLLAGVAWDMWVVIVARAFQGAGGGILIPVATAAVSDLYPPEERGKIQGALGALFGVGMGAGPLIGGQFAAMGDIFGLPGWHYAFLINIPIVIAVFLLTMGEFPSVSCDKKPVIDYKGIALISLALIGVVIFFQYVGKQFDVISIQTLIFIALLLVVLRLFTWNESKVPEPIIAPHVFSNPTVRAAGIMLFLLGFTLVGDELFMGLYLQKVTDHTPSEAGLFILMTVAGMMVTSVVGGALLNKTGVKIWVIAGAVFMAAGFFMFSMIEVTFNVGLFCASEFVYGLGAGCLLSSLMTAVQNSCEHKDVGMTTSSVNLLRNIGSTVGTSVFTLLVNAVIVKEAAVNIHDPELARDIGSYGLGILDHLGIWGADVDAVIKLIFTNSVATAFFFGAVILLIAVYVGFRFKVVTCKQSKEINEYVAELTKDNNKY